MKKTLLLFSFLMLLATYASGQSRMLSQNNNTLSGFGNSSGQSGSSKSGARRDSTSNKNKQIPKGVHVWTVDKRFGDRTVMPLDTVTHMFQNSIYTSGLYSDYNTTGNLGAPRINRIFIDRKTDEADFLFTEPYDYFVVKPEQFFFTNTYSPYANLTYNTCGNRTNGEDHFQAKYGVNVNKRLGFGFTLNYLYGRGYYTSQSTSLFNLNLYGSYIGDQYQAHLLVSTNKQKVTENGGITNDLYITHPETFDDNYVSSEIPTMFEQNWNRNSHQHVFLTHRYNLGFSRKVKMTEEEIEAKKFAMQSKEDNKYNKKKKGKKGEDEEEEEEEQDDWKHKKETFAGRPDNAVIAGDDKARNDSTKLAELPTIDMATADSLAKQKDVAVEDTAWMKYEFVPVTSFIHTAQVDIHDRIYQAYESPTDYYADNFYSEEVATDDNIFDQTKYLRVRNTFALSLLEGFNKWAFAGIKAFIASDFRHYALPDETNVLQSDNNHNLSLGGKLSRTQGKTLHYSVIGETWVMGEDIGNVKVDGTVDLNFPLFGDTVTLAAKGFFHNESPNHYLRKYHSRHYWWDDDLTKQTHTRIEGLFSYQKTRTTLRVAVDALTNYTYLGTSYTSDSSKGRLYNKVGVYQSGDPISVLTASVNQKFTFGIVNWETIATYQASTSQSVLPVPTLNVYTNLYLKFRIAKVLYTELGADVRYFTEYEAPDYVPGIGQFAVQKNDEKVMIGNYPFVTAYANFNLKGTRFFVMYSHANAGTGNKNYFLSPHYPTNGSVLRFGLSWNFFN